MTTITIQSPVRVSAPRGARVAAYVALQLWEVLEAAWRARAERRAQTRREIDASELRQYAMRFVDHDPRFTSDLLSAADRHNGGM